ncbi:MAG: amidohydrolase [Bacteroidales bacterium]|nr:amidohydrolase [Bacteroidales bacterium]
MANKINPVLISNIKDFIHQNYDDVFETFKRLNRVPEILFDLPETIKIIKPALQSIPGMEVFDVEGAPCCLVGILKNGEGPVIAYRTDLDGLRINDLTNTDWSSKIGGNSHSCGHSTHIVSALMIAKIMSAFRNEWSGTFLVYGQASEEGGTMGLGSGAQCMIKNGLLTKFPKPSKVLAIHCDPFRPAGLVRLCKGVAFAHTSLFEIKICGEAAHGGMPFKGIDTILLACRIVEGLQSIVSRELNPKTEPAVLTIGSFHAGKAANAVPAQADLSGTIRCFSEETYHKICNAIRRIMNGLAQSMGVPQSDWPELVLYPVFAPQLINDVTLGDQLETTYRAVLTKPDNIELNNTPEFYGEDFANYGLTGDKIPIFLTWIGSVEPKKFDDKGQPKEELPSLHDGSYTPYWDKNDQTDTMRTAALTQSCALLNLFASTD